MECEQKTLAVYAITRAYCRVVVMLSWEGAGGTVTLEVRLCGECSCIYVYDTDYTRLTARRRSMGSCLYRERWVELYQSRKKKQ